MTHYPHTRGGLPCAGCRKDDLPGLPILIDSPDESLYRARFQGVPPEGAWALPQPDGSIRWHVIGEMAMRLVDKQVRIDRLEDGDGF